MPHDARSPACSRGDAAPQSHKLSVRLFRKRTLECSTYIVAFSLRNSRSGPSLMRMLQRMQMHMSQAGARKPSFVTQRQQHADEPDAEDMARNGATHAYGDLAGARSATALGWQVLRVRVRVRAWVGACTCACKRVRANAT
jgi:hypothetical protein